MNNISLRVCVANSTDSERTEHSPPQRLFPQTNVYKHLLLMYALKSPF